MVDLKTGEKHCVEMLALHFEALQYSEFLGLLGSASVILAFLLPVVAIFLGVVDFRRRASGGSPGNSPTCAHVATTASDLAGCRD